MIKAIIFDCFGVLTTDLWKQFCRTLPDEIARKAEELSRHGDAGLISKDEFLARVSDLAKCSQQHVAGALGNAVLKDGDLLEYIKQLRPQYKIGLLSNISSDWIIDTLLTEDEAKLFDDMVFSHQVHVVKPDPQIFKLAIERLDVQPSETVFIDDAEHNVAAARALGIHALTYKDLKQMKCDLSKILSSSKG